MTSPTSVAFLGIGLMGLPMAKNLLSAGFNVSAWNRSHDKAMPLQAFGATICTSAADAVMNKDIVISMVSNGDIVGSLSADPTVRQSIKQGAVWVDMSSTKPEEATAVSKSLSEIGVQFIDAPVSGGTKGAEAGTLAIMAGANAADFEKVIPVLSAMGRPVHVGPVGAGQLAKLANQLIVGSTIAAVAEAMLLLEKGGASPEAVRLALKGGFADSTILQQHGERMTTGNFTPGALSTLQLKDLDNILAEAERYSLTLPTTQLTQTRYARYIDELGGADKDHSGLYEELLDLNPLHDAI